VGRVVVAVNIILLVLLGLACSGAAAATLSSEPAGGVVCLSGPVRISGVTPFELVGRESGLFRLRLENPGFETEISWLDITYRGETGTPSITPRGYLPETALTLAGIAGPSKFLRGEREKGILLSLAQGAAALAAGVEELRARDYSDRYEEALNNYREADDEQEAAVYHDRLLHNFEVARIARETRDICLVAAAFPWLSGFLENFVLDRPNSPLRVGNDALTFRLDRLNVPSAMLRGTLFPGMGHMYAGRRGAGYFWGGVVMSTVGAAIVSNAYYDECRLDYDEAMRDYLRASTEEDAEAARKVAEDKFDRMDDARNVRRALIGTAGGLWLLSILDSARFPLRYDARAGSLHTRTSYVDLSVKRDGASVSMQLKW